MYQVVVSILHPADARTGCPSGFGLAMPRTQDAQTDMVSVLGSASTSYVWAGAKRIGDIWKWDDGSPMSAFTNWAPSEPSNVAGQEYLCIKAFGDDVGKWYDCDNSIHLNVVCQELWMNAPVTAAHQNSSIVTDASNIEVQSGPPLAWIIFLVFSCLLLPVVAYFVHQRLLSRRPMRVPHDEEAATAEHPNGDSSLALVLPNSSSREVRSAERRMFPGTTYSMVVDPEGLAHAPNALLVWARKLCGPCMDTCKVAWDHITNLSGFLWKGYFPNDRREVAYLVLSAALFYVDILTDIGSALVFGGKYHFGYMAWTSLALFSTVVRVWRSPHAELRSFLIEPGRLAWQGLSLEPSEAAHKPVWTNRELYLSTKRFKHLSTLRSLMWSVTRIEAEVQASCNTLVQMYAVYHESYGWQTSLLLLSSAFVGFLSLLRTLHAFDERGHVAWEMKTQHGRKFPYVLGVGVTPTTSGLIVLFRAGEISSRFGTLATMQAVLRSSFPEDLGNALVMPILILLSSLGLFIVGEIQRKPFHGNQCFLGAFVFPGPLLLPAFVKTSVVSSAAFYAIRGAETLVLWSALILGSNYGVIPPLDWRNSTLLWFGAFFSLCFCIAMPFSLRWIMNYDHSSLRKQIASQLDVNRDGCIVWPVPEDGGGQLSEILEGYGFRVREESEPLPTTGYKAIDLASSAFGRRNSYRGPGEEEEKTEEAEHDEDEAASLVWCKDPHSLDALTSRNLVFTRDSGLSDDTADRFTKIMTASMEDGEQKVTVQRIRFEDSGNSKNQSMSSKVSEDTWQKLLASIVDTDKASSIIELAFCGHYPTTLLNEQKATAIAEVLPNFHRLLKLDLSSNVNIKANGWREIFEAVRGEGIRELALMNCNLDEEEAEKIGKGLDKLEELRKLNLSGNASLPGAGWISLELGNLNLEELILARTFSKTDHHLKSEAIAESIRHLKKLKLVDLSGNSNVPSRGWRTLLSACAGIPIQTLILSQCGIDDELAESIGEELQEMLSLTKLDLSGNEKLTIVGWGHLLEPLSQLQILRLDTCDLNDSVADQIMATQILPRLSKLWKLDFSGNARVTPHVWRHLMQHDALRNINLTGCVLTKNIHADLLTALTTKPFVPGQPIRFRSDPPVPLGLRGQPCGTEANQVHTLNLDLCSYSDEAAVFAFAQFTFASELCVKITTEHICAVGMALRHGRVVKVDLKGSTLTTAGWQELFAVLDGTCIEELSLQNCSLDEFKARTMSEVQPVLPKLRKANLHGNSLSPAGWKLLLTAFSKTSVEEVGDIFTFLSDAKASKMAEGLATLKCLRRVDFSNNRELSASRWGALIGALAGMEIEELKVDHCELDDDKAEAIAEKLPQLKLSCMRKVILIGREETSYPTLIVKIASASALQYDAESPGKSDPYCICQVNKRESFRTTAVADTLNPVWNQQHTLTHFGENDSLQFLVADERYGEEKDKLFGQVRLAHDTFYPHGFEGDLELIEPKKKKKPHASMADAAGRASVKESVAAIGDVFTHATHAAAHAASRAVDHSYNMWKPVHSQISTTSKPSIAIPSLHISVAVMPEIKITSTGFSSLLHSLNGAQVQDLGCIFNELDETKAMSVASALPGLPALRRVDFSHSWNVSAETWEQLISALSGSAVEELMLRKCRVNDAKARSIAVGLSKLRDLRQLDLSWNREVSGAGWAAIVTSLQHSAISELNFEYCLLSDTKVQAIAEALPDLQGRLLRKGLLLAGNCQISEQGMRMIADALAPGTPRTDITVHPVEHPVNSPYTGSNPSAFQTWGGSTLGTTNQTLAISGFPKYDSANDSEPEFPSARGIATSADCETEGNNKKHALEDY